MAHFDPDDHVRESQHRLADPLPSLSGVRTASALAPASPPRHDADTPLPQRVGSYRLLEKIGEGGMGVVYKAEQRHPRRLVALKLIRPMLATARSLRRFEHEAEALGRLQHPGIARSTVPMPPTPRKPSSR